MPEWVDNSGDWFFRSLITSAKLTGDTFNEQAAHENAPRLTRQFESGYTRDAGMVVANNFETEHFAILCGVRVVGPAELAGPKSILGADLVFPTGPGLGPFLRKPVFAIAASGFYAPDMPGADRWDTFDVGTAVPWTAPEEWPLVNLAVPLPELQNFRVGVSFYLRTAGLGSPSSPVNLQTTFDEAAHYFIFWHAFGPVEAYV